MDDLLLHSQRALSPQALVWEQADVLWPVEAPQTTEEPHWCSGLHCICRRRERYTFMCVERGRNIRRQRAESTGSTWHSSEGGL